MRGRPWGPSIGLATLVGLAAACGGGAEPPDDDLPAGAVRCDDSAADQVSFCLANDVVAITPRRDAGFGSGVGVLDIDGDGWVDLFVGGDGTLSRLYRNDGGAFVDVTTEAGLGSLNGVHGVVVADYDNDGDPDLFVTRQLENRLYRNDEGQFVDVSASAGVTDAAWGSSAAFADVDGDGWLDLVVANWSDYLDTGDPQANKLYRNRGDGTFEDVSDVLGSVEAGATQAVAVSDYDNDGDADLLIGNDFGILSPPNRLLRNDTGTGPIAFTDVSGDSKFDFRIFAMNVTAADIDRDGDLDYYLTNIGCNVLARNDGGVFADVSRQSGVGLCDVEDPGVDYAFEAADPGSMDPEEVAVAAYQRDYVANSNRPAITSWAALFIDVDQDGWQDLFVANGWIGNVRRYYQDARQQPNSLLLNRGDGAFDDVTAGSGLGSADSSRSAVAIDYDADGDLDLVVTQLDTFEGGAWGTLVYENRMAAGNWIEIRLEGAARSDMVGSNRDGVGARVTITVAGTAPQTRERWAGGGYLSAPAVPLHFGVGAASVVDVEVRWPAPSTTIDRCRQIAAGQVFTVREGDCP